MNIRVFKRFVGLKVKDTVVYNTHVFEVEDSIAKDLIKSGYACEVKDVEPKVAAKSEPKGPTKEKIHVTKEGDVKKEEKK